MSATSAAARLRQIAAELRAAPEALRQFGAGEIASAAGDLLDEAIRLGAFAGPEYANLRALITRQKRLTAQSPQNGLFGPLEWRVGAWDEAVTCLAPELRAGAPGTAWRDGCGPIADLIDAEAAKTEEDRGTPGGGEGHTKHSKARRGRPKLPEAERQRRRELQDKWVKAKNAGVRQKDFCRDEGITLKELQKKLNWCSQETRRGNFQ